MEDSQQMSPVMQFMKCSFLGQNPMEKSRASILNSTWTKAQLLSLKNACFMFKTRFFCNKFPTLKYGWISFSEIPWIFFSSKNSFISWVQLNCDIYLLVYLSYYFQIIVIFKKQNIFRINTQSRVIFTGSQPWIRVEPVNCF